MTDAQALSLAGVIITALVVGLVGWLQRTKHSSGDGNPGWFGHGNSYVRESTCIAKHEGVQDVKRDVERLTEKVDKILMHLQIPIEN